MKDLPISNDELLKLLKTRLGHRNKLELHKDVIYQEYLEICGIKASSSLKHINLVSLDLVLNLRKLADTCNKIESPVGVKDVKRVPILQSILNQLESFELGAFSVRLIMAPVEMKKGALQTARSLAYQARGYYKIAFDFDTFEDASTKLSDAADVLELAQDIYKSDMVSARKHKDFDTIIREDISVKAWNWIQNNI